MTVGLKPAGVHNGLLKQAILWSAMSESALGSSECTRMNVVHWDHGSVRDHWAESTGIDESALSSPQCTEIMGIACI